MGDDARRDEARRGGHPGHDRCSARADLRRPGRARRRPARRRRAPPTPASSTTCRATTRGSRSASRSTGWLRYARRRRRRRAASRPTAPTARRRPAAALLHLRHDRAAQARRAHPRRPTRSATCRRCTGSACSPATCTSTSPRPAGPSTPGSCFFAPWIAEATVFVYNYARFDAGGAARRSCARCEVTTFCAPPTVWRMLIQADLVRLAPVPLREVRRRRRAAQPRGDRAGPGAPGG